ncbi:hypothetical protein EVAR_31179_1 [Eumeta japonica]|uniref:Uncharacterized protein n=1 Tax=Eumeta variegata TaxID=151549 RepID=A0A4C1VZP4_EUMVA|nr:hypothetical protein EVAR_31179_1 [Eumeta japonica]
MSKIGMEVDSRIGTDKQSRAHPRTGDDGRWPRARKLRVRPYLAAPRRPRHRSPINNSISKTVLDCKIAIYQKGALKYGRPAARAACRGRPRGSFRGPLTRASSFWRMLDMIVEPTAMRNNKYYVFELVKERLKSSTG